LQKLGFEEDAQKVFAHAQELLDNQASFLTSRSLVYLKVGDPQLALVDVQGAIKIDPNSPEAYFQMGKAYEELGDFNRAVDSYQNASDLATKQGKTELVPIIRMNLGMAMQRMGMQGGNGELTPTVLP
jgi:Tfp pilus assembly protein PilF